MAGGAQKLVAAAESGHKDDIEAATKQIVPGKPAANDNARSVTKEQVGLALAVTFSAAHWALVGYGYWRMPVG
jgi:hypothetical protein